MKSVMLVKAAQRMWEWRQEHDLQKIQNTMIPPAFFTPNRIQMSKAVTPAHGVMMLRPPNLPATRLGSVRPKTDAEFKTAKR